jgi:ribosomal protein S18 acetylase RimI-like enzyme
MTADSTPHAGLAIERARVLTPDFVRALAELIPVLSAKRPPPDAAQLRTILEDERLHLFLARDPQGAIAGMVTLILYQVPTGQRARIEDLVVSPRHRGLGLGRALMERAMLAAREAHAHVLDLTSNPSRLEANQLYLSLGFTRWETNVYRRVLDEPGAGPPG